MTNFLLDLGSVARGGDISFAPNPSRELLKARSPLQPQRYEQVMSHAFGVPSFKEVPLLPFNPTLGSVNNFTPAKHVFKSFPFSHKVISELKQRAVTSEPSLKLCSTFEAVSALVLKEIAKARPLQDSELMAVFLAVDFRKKLVPPVPREFCGNAIATACMTATAGDLRTKSIGHFTHRIQQIVRSVDDEFVRSWTDFWEMKRIGPAMIPIGACVSGWWKLPFYDFDFGCGTPVYIGPVPNQLVGFVVLLDSGKRDGSINAYLSLEQQEMSAFQRSLDATLSQEP